MTRAEQIRDQFSVFHRENPGVFVRFKYHAENLQGRGARHYSARTLISVIRFERDLANTRLESGRFKINDHFSPYYARLWEIATGNYDFMEKRKLISEEYAARGDDGEPGPGDTRPDEPSEELDQFLKALL